MHKTRRLILNAGLHPARLRFCAGLGLAVLLALVCGLTGRSQSNSSNGGQGQGQGSTHRSYSPRPDFSPLNGIDDADPVMTERRIRALNIQRQKQIVADTDKLLKLARELNQEVAQANTGTLTLDELHKIAEIEKLARNVRQRMTDAPGEAPAMLPLPPPPLIYPNH